MAYREQETHGVQKFTQKKIIFFFISHRKLAKKNRKILYLTYKVLKRNTSMLLCFFSFIMPALCGSLLNSCENHKNKKRKKGGGILPPPIHTAAKD